MNKTKMDLLVSECERFHKERDEARAECERLRKERDKARAESVQQANDLIEQIATLRADVEQLRKERDDACRVRDEYLCELVKQNAELAKLSAPRTDGKEPGQRAYEAWAESLDAVAVWQQNVKDFGNNWAKVERVIEAPLLAKIVGLNKEVKRLRQAIADMPVANQETPEPTMQCRTCAHWEPLTTVAECGYCHHLHAPMPDTTTCDCWVLKTLAPGESPEHELKAAVAQAEKQELQWVPTDRLRWLRGDCEHGRYKLQQLYQHGEMSRWQDVEVV